LLTANDAWFMPVSQKIGPDGCLYVLDWYDQYHCYQDAQRDPGGIDRSYGRLYRICYKGTPHAGKIDLSKETDAELIERLRSPIIYYRETAQRLLSERNSAQARPLLQAIVLDSSAAPKAQMHALWSLIGAGPLDKDFHLKLLRNEDPSLRAWGVRAAGNAKKVGESVAEQVRKMSADPSPDVKLQVAIAARKIEGLDAPAILLDALAHAGKDPLIPAIVWQNLQPLMDDRADEILKRVAENESLRGASGFAEVLPRLIERTIGRVNPDIGPIVTLFALASKGDHPDVPASQKCLAMLAEKIQDRELNGPRLDELRAKLEPLIAPIVSGPRNGPLFMNAALLSATWKDSSAIAAIREALVASDQSDPLRLQALAALLAAGDSNALDSVAAILAKPKQSSIALRAGILGALGRAEDARVGQIVLKNFQQLEPELQPKAIELLTQRPEWAKPLLDAIGRQEIPSSALNVNQVRKLLASHDDDLVAMVTSKWGSVRTERNPQREQVVADVRKLLTAKHGDAKQGEVVFKRVCAQCHKIYGEGQDVGPDITANGRASFDQLLSNVLDPSLVIGASYQARLVTTTDGRTLTGLLAEDSPQRIVLKEQGGKLETVPRSEVESITVSKLSLMPEGLEKQLTEKELVDLFEFLLWDKQPSDPAAKRLPGAPR
jgi:putative heme-binding domain-containing protein